MAEIEKYRKRPTVVEILEWTGSNLDEMQVFTRDPDTYRTCFEHADEFLEEHRQGDAEITAFVWDKLHSTWVGVKTHQRIIKGVQGEFYPIDVDVLAQTYEKVR